jgi:hypothetical protein
MNRRELNRKLDELYDANEWAYEADVKLDINGLVVDIGDIEFDRERGEYFIKAVRR